MEARTGIVPETFGLVINVWLVDDINAVRPKTLLASFVCRDHETASEKELFSGVRALVVKYHRWFNLARGVLYDPIKFWGGMD